MPEVLFPKRFIDFDKLDKEILKALEKVYVAELIKRTPKLTGFTASQWESFSLGDFSYAITNPKGDVIAFLEEGTKAHVIRPKSKKMLKFPLKDSEGNWVAPTLRTSKDQRIFREHGQIWYYNKLGMPVLGYSKEGSRYFCFARKVNHPGFKGIHFIFDILQDKGLEEKFKSAIESALARA